MNLDLSFVPEHNCCLGRKSYSNHSMICSFIIMKCEGFCQITDLVDFLNNNLIIAHYAGFDITKPLPSYWSFERFIKNFDISIFKDIMKNQVSFLEKKGIIDSSFIGLDSTPILANTCQNNPKSFSRSKFSKSNQPKSDLDCKLGVHSASNQFNEKNFDFYWGYKNHSLVDLISGLPIYEITTTANVADSSVALDILKCTHSFLPLDECSFVADKGYDVKILYYCVHTLYDGECIIPLNKRNSKDRTLYNDALICDAGLEMKNGGIFSDSG